MKLVLELEWIVDLPDLPEGDYDSDDFVRIVMELVRQRGREPAGRIISEMTVMRMRQQQAWEGAADWQI